MLNTLFINAIRKVIFFEDVVFFWKQLAFDLFLTKNNAHTDWREEKEKCAVQSICRTLASTDIPQTMRDEIGGQALWNTLRLFTEALEERVGSSETKWSSALISLFITEPDQRVGWGEFMNPNKLQCVGEYLKRLLLH